MKDMKAKKKAHEHVEMKKKDHKKEMKKCKHCGK